jgi:MYXO-CTERM domain-containing protein
MEVRRLFLALAGAGVLAGCASEVDSGPGLSTTDHEIIRGTQASVGQFPTVVAILIANGNRGLCTGTLVAPDIVLTAAHCIHPRILGYSTQAQVTANTSIVFDDVNLNDGVGQRIAAAETIPITGFGQPGDPDVGLIFLASELTDRTPTPLNLTPSKASVGVLGTLVGFGETETGTFGRLLYGADKSSTSCGVIGMGNLRFLCYDQRSGSGICQGDSGGPVLSEVDGVTKVIGIASFGDQTCGQFGAHMRVDASETRGFLLANAPQLVCRRDGACDEICGTEGLPEDPDCRQPCTTDSECLEDEYCSSSGVCEPEPFSPGGVGSVCAGDEDCVSGLCASAGGESRCTDRCDGAAACPAGFDCAGGLCWPDSGGCCSASGGGAGSLALGLLVIGALALRRRRWHRRAI